MRVTMVKIATSVDYPMDLCSATIVGRGLAVAFVPRFGKRDSISGYTLTHMVTGYRVGGFFRNGYLAVRCARELVKISSFEQSTAEEAVESLRPQKAMLYSIIGRYADLDKKWAKHRDGDG